MTTISHYTLQNLVPGQRLHAELASFFITPESAEPLQSLINRAVATERCFWGCTTTHSREEARSRMARLMMQMNSVLNPHKLLDGSVRAERRHVLDPRIRDIITRFLPTLPAKEGYSFSEIDQAAETFAQFAQTSGLQLFAITSPCHTNSPQALTCRWSNFPASVDEAVSLKSGKDIHPKLAGTYLTQRAAAGLGALISRGETPVAQATLAELLLQFDMEFNPYLVIDHRIIIDGSVAALESFIAQNPPPTPARISEGYAHYIQDTFKLKWASKLFTHSAYQMLCAAEPGGIDAMGGTALKIICGYKTTAADVD